MKKDSCILLLSKNEYLAQATEDYCRTLYNVKCVVRNERGLKKLPKEVYEASKNGDIDYIFNFLSAVKVPRDIINSARKLAINFHPAPPEFPGVGCASYALYSKAKEYGVTAHIMEETYDSGKILKVVRFPISKGDYCDTLFDRSLNYLLILFYDVLYELATKGNIKPCGEKWERKASTRKQFEKWMTLTPEDSDEDARLKIRAAKHNRFTGPYVEIFEEKFVLEPRKKEGQE